MRAWRQAQSGCNPMTDKQIGWTAGILDGEGYIGLSRNRDSYKLTIQVANKSFPLVHTLYELWGGGLQKPYTPNDRCQPVHRWFIYSSAAAFVLEMVLPCLIGKHAVAEVSLAYHHGRLSGTEAHKRCLMLNKRGA